MAEICCGFVGETESTAAVEATSKKHRRLELLPFKFVADVAVPLLETGRKKRKLDLYSPSSSMPRDCSNAVENSNCSKEFDDELERNKVLSLSGDSSDVEAKDEVAQECPKFGVTSVCGRRRDMEDAVSVHPSFREGTGTSPGFHFFGVFDGHGGSIVAMKCKDRLHQIVKEELDACGGEPVEWKHAMERSFASMDAEVQQGSVNDPKKSNGRCDLQTPKCDAVGSTAVVAVVTPDKIVVSNCGDSRAVLCRNGVATPLSSDHKPDRPDELARIEAAGGRVIYWDGARVLGVLAMSRAIGDNYLKPYVIPDPEVTVTERTAEDECLILASDGLWDVVSNDTACGVARMCLRSQKPPSPPCSPGSDSAVGSSSAGSSDKACSDAAILLTKLALARHSTDNVSVVVIDLRKRGGSSP
ncbi:protein phosphatase 2C 37 [Tripterygium wilfordii]|uniref:protein-serine/threonine phosphatase n=1 Tax=Tripterygium wilfordii TaxID=458696 RepID=A0A7J7CIF4_TRIWF|nr:protein phosphatase 2C 37-like [Tripterygium wilfordii]KAF5733835.1 protein phosphatase 2C 37 [Tripterygium wilfordii]